jgi:hypothetical protein
MLEVSATPSPQFSWSARANSSLSITADVTTVGKRTQYVSSIPTSVVASLLDGSVEIYKEAGSFVPFFYVSP